MVRKAGDLAASFLAVIGAFQADSDWPVAWLLLVEKHDLSVLLTGLTGLLLVCSQRRKHFMWKAFATHVCLSMRLCLT